MTTDTTDATDSAFGALALRWTLGWGTGAARALVVMKAWEWFVADTFDVTTISFIQAWGLTLLASFATLQPTGGTDDDGRSSYHKVGVAVVTSLFLSVFFFLNLWILSAVV